jgi:hypothetical protein
MRLQLRDWFFDIDMTGTMEYSAAEAAEHCDCAYCRNFYAALDGEYPGFRTALATFGVDAEAPEELMPYDLDGRMIYDAVWAVRGKVIQKGREVLSLGGVTILPDPDNVRHVNCWCPEPYFLLDISGLELPWVLDEPLEAVVSPANEPSFLAKMWDKLFADKDGTHTS